MSVDFFYTFMCMWTCLSSSLLRFGECLVGKLLAFKSNVIFKYLRDLKNLFYFYVCISATCAGTHKDQVFVGSSGAGVIDYCELPNVDVGN